MLLQALLLTASLTANHALVAQPAAPAAPAAVEPAKVAAAHGLDKIPAGTVFHGRLTVTFGGNTLLDDAEIWFTPDAATVRIETSGTVAVANGGGTFVSPPDAKLSMPRFQLYTWPYFAMAPFKIGDAGVKLAPMPPADGKARARMTFAPGTGDAPDDWYVLYVNAKQQLAAMAYIVTYGKTQAEAEKEPHAIVYGDFADVPGPDGRPTGVLVSTRFSFRHWSADTGVGDEEIGGATLAGLELIAPPAGAFDKPAGAKEVKAPR